MGRLLSREDILSSDDIAYDIVPVPEWGGDVRIKALTGDELERLQRNTIHARGRDVEANLKGLRQRMVVLACVDEQGARLFTAADVEALGKKSGRALERVVGAINKLVGFTPEEVEEMTATFDDAPSEPDTSA